MTPIDRSWLVLANSDAGSATRRALGTALAVLAADAPARLVWTTSPDEVGEVLGADPDATPVVFGGDGTISLAAARIMGADMGGRPVGLLPGGTGNDTVRGLGLPLEVDRAAEALLRARPHPLPALRVTAGGADADGTAAHDELRAINAVHLGVGAASSRRAASFKRYAGPLAYPMGAALTGATQRHWDFEVRVDGEVLHSGPGLMVAVALGRTIGGGATLGERGAAGPRPVEVLVAPGEDARARLRLATAVGGSEPAGQDLVRATATDRVEVRSDRPVPLNVDGEDGGDVTRVELAVEPDAWTVLLP